MTQPEVEKGHDQPGFSEMEMRHDHQSRLNQEVEKGHDQQGLSAEEKSHDQYGLL
jgi:hypothetical protein